MVAQLSSIHDAPPATGRRNRGRCRPTTAMLVAFAAALVLTASAAFRPQAPVQAQVVVPYVEVVPVNLAPTRAATIRRHQIEALAGHFAKKYRVSAEATREYLAHAYREADRLGIDPLLLVAVISVESNFNPIAESPAGAVGLMQVIPRFHTDKYAHGQESALAPHTNIRIGALALKEYIRRAGGLVEGLQLYNGSADDETTAYANKVLGEKQRLLAAVKSAGMGA